MYRRLFLVCLCLLTAILVSAPSQAQEPFLRQAQVVYDDLSNPVGVTISPDGKHVYAAGDALLAYERNATTGALTGVDIERDGVNGVDGLAGALSVTVAPDGAHVYAAGLDDNALAVFSRNSGTGALTFVEVVRDGINGVDGLAGAVSATVAPDGAHVYAAGVADSALAVFARDGATGALTFIEVIRDGINGVDGLAAASSVTVAPDGAHVYAAGVADSALAVFARDGATGALTFVEVVRDGANGVEGLINVKSVTVSPDGAHVYATGEFDSALAVFTRDTDTGALTFVEVLRNGVNGVEGLGGANSVTVAPDGANVYAAGRNSSALAVFARDSDTGALAFLEVVRDGLSGVDGLDGVVSVAVAPDGAHVYSAGLDDEALAVFVRDADAGALTFGEVIRDGVNGVDGLAFAQSVAVTPDGAHVYTAGGRDDALAVFAREEEAGALTFVGVVRDGVNGVDGLSSAGFVTVAPDGAHIYAAGYSDSALAVFARDGATGELTFIEVVRNDINGVDGLDGASSVSVSPDGAHVYATGALDNALAVFARDAGTGALTFVEVLFDGISINDVDGLDGAQSVAVTPDGAHIYAAGGNDSALAVFARDAGTGALTFVEVVRDGVNGVDGLGFARSVTVTPDGGHVYAAGPDDNALAVFARDSDTGALAFVEVVRDGVNGADGLAGANSVTVAPDGAYVYAAGSHDNALAVFARDQATGALTFVEVVRNGVNGVDGLFDVRAVAVAPDDTNVYAASPSPANAIAAFEKTVFASFSGTISEFGTDDPVSCAAIELANGGRSFVRTAVTDVNGYYFFENLPADTYTVSIYATGFGVTLADAIVLVENERRVQNYGVIPAASNVGIRGRVIDADTGEPLVAVRIDASVEGNLVATTYTCASGNYEFSDLGIKGGTTVKLDFTLDNYVLENQEVPVFPNQTAEADEQLQKVIGGSNTLTGNVQGKFDDGRVEPLAGATVTLRGAINASRTSDANGYYAFEGLLDGTYTIRASAVEYQGQTVSRIVAGGGVVKSFVLDREATTAPTIPADINGDSTINAVDVQLVINAALGLDIGGLSADVNTDNAVNAVDVQLVINAALGL